MSQNGYLEFIFTEMLIELSSTCHMVFVQIAVFDWWPGRQKWFILEKKTLLRNHKVDEADTSHTCL